MVVRLLIAVLAAHLFGTFVFANEPEEVITFDRRYGGETDQEIIVQMGFIYVEPHEIYDRDGNRYVLQTVSSITSELILVDRVQIQQTTRDNNQLPTTATPIFSGYYVPARRIPVDCSRQSNRDLIIAMGFQFQGDNRYYDEQGNLYLYERERCELRLLTRAVLPR